MVAAWPGLRLVLPPSGKLHRAFSFEDEKSLVSVVAMHLVFLPRLVVVHPGVKTRRIENVLAAFFLVGQIDHIDDFDAHDKLLLTVF